MKRKGIEKKRFILLSISFFCLIIGFLIYLFFNQNTPISSWMQYINIHENKLSLDNLLITMITNFGADFLWSLSFTIIVQFILWLQKKHTFYLIFCSALGAIYELMQCFGLANGTADIIDVIVYTLGSLFAIIIIQGGKLYEEK